MDDVIILNPEEFMDIFMNASFVICSDDEIAYDINDRYEDFDGNIQVALVPADDDNGSARIITDEMLNNDVEYLAKNKEYRFTVGDFPSFMIFLPL